MILKKEVGKGSSGTSVKMKSKESKLYDGTKSAKVIGNSCWDVY